MDKDLIGSPKDSWININTSSNHEKFIQLINVINKDIEHIYKGGGEIAIEKQHSKGKMTARERINYLIDNNSFFSEIGSMEYSAISFQ